MTALQEVRFKARVALIYKRELRYSIRNSLALASLQAACLRAQLERGIQVEA